ncbi:2-C-methyl-D-erythritol 4-phosphate cytidylyltransferase [Bacteroidia bacterium]|nr:2-C-methyl-D-erythritol 4-phosphate cytidylyltransferase [Bacteroidia bacterium]GHT47078.1 2-C-methyl-D-erythritol 4-phosphate cytidylyltransferase [Bacteroidia bacterium]GHT89322.1 2-C-methyl-D-erythritol 4-phosphate cytidylyltransferase [Bacteroidia bacterium]
MTKKYVIIVAAGKGSRMETDVPKQFLLLHGKPVLMHAMEAFYNYDSAMQIILVLPPEQKSYWRGLCKEHNFKIKHQTANGGETRFYSVKNGLKLVKEDSLVAVHDAARPLVSQELIAMLFQTAEEKKAAYPAISVSDTLRRLIINGSSKIMDRSKFFRVQTPQVFFSKILIHAYKSKYSEKYTDDVSVVETRRLCKPTMVEGSNDNIKITTPIDLVIAEAIFSHRKSE